MADVHNKLTRSYNMSQIKGKNTGAELTVRSFLFKKGFRYTLHEKKLPGKPDIVLPKYKTIVHVHGCFWHGHDNCKDFVVPKSNQRKWIKKLNGNIERDKKNDLLLRKLGWQIIIIWECGLKPKAKIKTLERLALKIKNEKTYKSY